MSKCVNCIHYDVCTILMAKAKHQTKQFVRECLNKGNVCDHFKAKSLFVELPCKVGDTLYYFNLYDYEPCKKSGENGDVCPYLSAEYGFGYECKKTKYGEKLYKCAKIESIIIEDFFEIIHFWEDIGKTVFLTKEEAEAKLKEIGE